MTVNPAWVDDGALRRLRDLRCSPNDFVRATEPQWRAIAKQVVRRVDLPPGVDAEDAQQELLLALFEKGLVEKWDKTAGPTLGGYVVWTCSAYLRTWLNKQRGALRQRSGSPSRYPVCSAKLSAQDGESFDATWGNLHHENREESKQIARELVDQLERSAPTREVRTVLRALRRAEGDMELAATYIQAEPEWSRECQVQTAKDARRAIRDALNILRGTPVNGRSPPRRVRERPKRGQHEGKKKH